MSRALDALAAEHAMGYRWWSHQSRPEFRMLMTVSEYEHAEQPHTEECDDCIFYTEGRGPLQRVPQWSSDIACAILVQAEMHRRGFWMRLESPGESDSSWYCRFRSVRKATVGVANALSPSEVIVRAALCAVGVPEAEIEEARRGE